MVTRGLYIVFKKSRQTSGNEKSQLTYCIAGLFVYFFAAIDYLVNYGINFYPPGILFVMVSIAILAFAITKHELMDINVIITRSVSHIITGASVVITFLFIPIIPTPYSWIIDGLIGLFWARFGQSIHLFIQTTAEKKFLKGSYDYREVLTKFTHRFSRCATVSEVMTALDFHLVHDIEIRASAVLIPEGFDEKKELSGPYIPADTRTTVRLTDSDTLLKILHSTPETIYANQSSDTTKTLATLGCTAVVPCMHNDQLMAILLLGEKMSNDGFTRDDKGLFPLLGAQIGIVLNRLRQTRFEAELNIAQRIQSEILPRNPSISNLELACLMIPATEMGGDYYDIIHTPTGTWILLGDVTGHGVGSAMVMFMVQSIVTTLVKSNSVTTPSELLYNANRILCQNMQRLDEGRPLTIVALHTIDGRHFSYCGAHDAIMILRNDQPEVEMVEIDQFPFGIGMIQEMTLEEFGSGTLSLDPGDILFIGTDGITEAAKNGRYTSGTFGEAGLADCLITHRTKPLTEFSDALINQLKHYTNNTFHDDITFIAARSV
jgi:serine phosphatase RsbU (regulator of sigma subunit)